LSASSEELFMLPPETSLSLVAASRRKVQRDKDRPLVGVWRRRQLARHRAFCNSAWRQKVPWAHGARSKHASHGALMMIVKGAQGVPPRRS
jgi:hypothetical protein